MATSNISAYLELLEFSWLIAAYELLTELKLQGIRRDISSIWIDWSYPDGAWAGTICCDAPLFKAIEKLEREVTSLQEGINNVLVYDDEVLSVAPESLSLF